MADTKKTAGSTRSKTKKTQEKEKIKQMSLEKAEELRKKAEIKDEIISLVVVALGIFLFLSLLTSVMGIFGGWIKAFFLGLFGKAAYILPFFLIIYGIFVFFKKTSYVTVRSTVCCILFFFLMAVIFAGIKFEPLENITFKTFGELYTKGAEGGGAISMMLMTWITLLIGKVGMFILSVVGLIILFLFIFNTPIAQILDEMKIKRQARRAAKEERRLMQEVAAEIEAANKPKRPEVKNEKPKVVQPAAERPEKPMEFTTSLNELKAAEKKEVAVPTLNTAPLKQFEKENTVNKSTAVLDSEQVIPDEKPQPVKVAAEERKPHVFDDSYSDSQKKILGYVADDEHFGIMGSETAQKNSENLKPSADEMPAVPSGTKGVEPKEVKTVPIEQIGTLKKNPEPAAIEMKSGTEEASKHAEYVFPPISLLVKPAGNKGSAAGDLSELSRILEDTLASFGVQASVVDAIRGPAVTRFEVKPAAGVKVSKITSLHDDIAMNLSAKSLRIEAPIPGKSAVGIEVSNDDIKTVYLREILESKEFVNHKSKIGVGLGKTISGEPVVADLKKMPHLLVAGATGSGKSVCINSIIMSILYKAKPDEVKLILIDPKVVELSNYNGIPHLLIPVVTEPAKASAALGWAVSEMEERYHKFAEVGVRDLEGYNDYMRAEEETDKLIPQMVIIIDELYDLMMAAANSVESSIGRLAAKARAAGIYLIVATQRPSVDVITGVIKANIPSRIAFMVSSQVDSRTILDGPGAEHLLGKGDMLYFPTGISKPIRVQGCFVSDEEVNNVIEFVKSHKGEEKPQEQQAILNAMSKTDAVSGKQDEEEDDLLEEAIEFTVTQEECSVSKLQRKFRIGYNRSARLIEIMETMGIVGPSEGSKARKVLINSAEYDNMRMNLESSEIQEDE